VKSVLVAQLGARMHYSVPEILFRNKLLCTFYTDFYSGKFPFSLFKNSNIPVLQKFNTRKSSIIPSSNVKHFPVFGIESALNLRKAKNVNEQLEEFIRSGVVFSNKIIQDFDPTKTTTIYGFNTACLELFQFAKPQGIKLILEQTIAPFYVERILLQKEEQKFPDWIIETEKYDEGLVNEICLREKEEMLLADVILGASNFVKDSIESFLPEVKNKIAIVPYGVRNSIQSIKKEIIDSRPLRILVAGTVGLRKGSPYVLEAAKQLKGQAEFRMVGSVQFIPDAIRQKLSSSLDLRGLVPRNEMKEHYQWADVFLLPSVCEGSATVTYEAMQYGLPLIVTPNTGAIIEDGKQGFVIQVGNSDAIVNSILRLNDKELLKYFIEQVEQKKAETTFEAYETRLLKALSGFFN